MTLEFISMSLDPGQTGVDLTSCFHSSHGSPITSKLSEKISLWNKGCYFRSELIGYIYLMQRDFGSGSPRLAVQSLKQYFSKHCSQSFGSLSAAFFMTIHARHLGHCGSSFWVPIFTPFAIICLVSSGG
jgi:hypothetical protein